MIITTSYLQGGLLKIDFSLMRIRGTDSQEFLSGQLTQKIQGLEQGYPTEATLLTSQGRLCSPLSLTICSRPIKNFVNSGDFLILVEQQLADVVYQRLDKYLVSEDVEISVWHNSQLKSDFQLNFYVGIQQWFQLEKAEISSERFSYYQHPIFMTTQELANSSKVSADTFFLSALHQFGISRFNKEHTEKKLLSETPWVEFATSETKGCYPGQETVNKIRNNRGSAFFPAKLKTLKENQVFFNEGEVIYEKQQKVGTVLGCYADELFCYYIINTVRAYRIHKLQLESGEIELFQYDPTDLAREIFEETSSDYGKGLVNIHDSEAVLRYLIAFYPDYSDPYEGLAVILSHHERFDESLQLLDQLEELEPLSVLVHTNRSLIYGKMGMIEEAEAEKVKATVKTFKQKSQEAAQEKDRQKLEAQKRKERQERAQMFYQVLEIDDTDEIALLGLGEFYWEDKSYTKAIEYLNKLVETKPKITKGYLILGKCHWQLDNKDLAKQIWQKGVEVAAKNGDMMPGNEMQTLLLKN